jgi:hypothetical protein
VEDNVEDERVMNVGRRTLYPEWGAAYGIRQVETLNLVQPRWYRQFFFDFLAPNQPAGQFLEFGRDPDQGFAANASALDQVAARYLIVDTLNERMDADIAAQYPLVFEDEEAQVRIYENIDSFPRAYVSPALISVEQRAVGAPWDRGVASTEDERLLDEARGAGVSSEPGRAGVAATIAEDTGDRLVVEVDTPEPGVLTMGDTYHENWSAIVNGEPAHLGRVNHAFRGVVTPAGRSTVVFEYHPTARRVGLAISVVSLVGILGGTTASAVAARRHRNGRATPAAGQ